ncbi:CotH kinase family protein [Brevibacillus dissolubilis]|uniref:CotH kinase family protein n=1 Tax=Brevibacillus dissolubilis TaxID=1844116 RepID=UPI0021005BB8|nr:CotH kinase family protein [Brevibacillus dissolubilis]
MKNRYIVASVALLMAVLLAVMALAPQLTVKPEETDYSYTTNVFDRSKVTTVDITLEDSDLESMLATPLEEKFVSANVTINGETVENVGLRTKGNLTLRSVAQMEDSDRFSFKIDFDHYIDQQNLHGLKKLNLNNNYTDPSQMREFLSYSLMEKMGLPTPAFSYMYITINGKEWGLYLGVEAIEETFLARNFAEGTGDLYKPDGVGSDLKWISDDIDDYTGIGLKTNLESTDQSALINMLDAINNGGDISKVLDVDEMLRYFALNTALVNLDHYQGNLKHNYYLYEENGVFSMLPWDYNMAFAGFGVGGGGGGRPPGNAEGDAANQQQANAANRKNMGGPGGGDMAANFMDETNINFSITTPVSGATLADRPLLNALLAVPEYRDQFNENLKEIATTYFTEDYMGTMTAQVASLIAPYVEKDPTKFYTTEQFKESISGEKSLVQFSVKRAESILAQLSGKLVVAAVTSSDRGGFGGGAPGDRQAPPMGENGAPGDMPRLPMDGKSGPPGSATGGYSLEYIILSSGLAAVLVIAMIFARFFKRRRS